MDSPAIKNATIESTTALVKPPNTPIFPVPKLKRALPACVLAK
jgi:hypothetical protein